MRNKLNKDIGLIIKYSEYYLESFTYNEELQTFLDVDDNELDPYYYDKFIYEEDIKNFMKRLIPYIYCYKIIKPMDL